MDSQIKKEIRFAVVMYGGGSLAIYINGVTQELLKMNRATANDRTLNDAFTATENIYRKIALFLSDEKLQNDYKNKRQSVFLNQELSEAQKTKALSDLAAEFYNSRDLSTDNKTPCVRFMVDVVTGSSAGGINGVFLAKALANNQSIDRLKNLWLVEGDFNKLLNDKRSIKGSSLSRPIEPTSLLNSQRMYWQLLAALHEMDEEKISTPSKNVEELDLFVTVTDFVGVPVPLRQFDRIVYERRHRQFFHFKYDRDNDADSPFKKDFNPFLAFAARSTSSFPLAFEPMRFEDVDAVIDSEFGAEYGDKKSENPMWKDFFADFKLSQAGKTGEKEQILANRARYFVDGGALDNKPFGFALETLLKRQSAVPVDRKLIYIEPSPEFLDENGEIPKEPPDALQNLIAQASGLPRYETIREDLQALLERNRLIERVNRLIKNVENDFYALLANPETRKVWMNRQMSTEEKNLPQSNDSGEVWEKFGLKEIIASKGRAFLPYYRLRLISLTDNLARTITRFFDFDENSDSFLAIRSLVRCWRETEFKNNQGEEGKPTVNYFLRRYDLSYRLRRVRFVMRKAQELSVFDSELQNQLKIRRENEVEIRAQQVASERVEAEARNYASFLEKTENVTSDGEKLFPSEIIYKICRRDADAIERMRRVVYYYQIELNEIFRDLSCRHERLKTFRISSDFFKNLPEGEPEKAVFNAFKALITDDEKTSAGEFIDASMLEAILGEIRTDGKIIKEDFDEQIGLARAKQILFDRGQPTEIYKKLDKAAVELGDYLEKLFFQTSRDKILALLNPKKARAQEKDSLTRLTDEYQSKFDLLRAEDAIKVEPDLTAAVRDYLWQYYENFDDFDQISFPIFYETPVGEADVVEVVRISPHDAENLIDEKGEYKKKKELGRRKLAGDVLYGFGAFLDPAWRQNDIVWGRLDGAERLITALLPTGETFRPLRETFIREAHKSILEDELGNRYRTKLDEKMLSALLNAKSLGDGEEAGKKAVGRTIARLENSALEKDLSDVLASCLNTPEKLYDAVRSEYEIDRRLEPRDALQLASRSTQVIGKILQQVAEKNAQAGSHLAWIAYLGQIFWGLVEVAAPNSLLNKLFLHWIKIFYTFEVVLIVASTIFAKPDLQQFGIVTLIITAVIHLTVTFLHDKMLGNRFGRTLFRFVVGGSLAILVAAGMLFFYGLFYDADFWRSIVAAQQFLGQYERWQKLLPIVPFAILFLLVLLWREVETLNLRLIGRTIMAGFLAAAGLSVYFMKLTKAAPGRAPIIELEFVKNADEIKSVIVSLGANLEGMKTAIWWDTFAFVPLYLAILLMLSAFLNRRRKIKWAGFAALSAAFTAVIAAFFDWAENYYMLAALNQNVAQISDEMARNISLAAYVKWTSVFVSCGILSIIFLRYRRNFWNIIFFLLLVFALAGIIGTLTYPSNLFGIPLVTIALISEFLILGVIGIVFQFKSLRSNFLQHY